MNKKMYQVKLAFVVFFSLTVLIPTAWAEYPDHPIRLICGWPAGRVDLPGRAISEPTSKILGQPIIVETMVGATGTKALAAVSNAKPDGYTLGVVVTTGITEKPHVMEISFDPMKGFTPIMLFGWNSHACVARKDAPWNNFKELIEYAKANPGKVKYGTNGYMSTTQIMIERLQILDPSIKMVAVPYSGGGPVMTALLGGHIQVGLAAAEAKPFVESGEVKMLASFNVKRWKSFPNIPTAQELGYPSVNVAAGAAIMGPPNLPVSIRQKLENSFKEGMKDQVFLNTMSNLELNADYMSSVELGNFLRKTYEETGETLRRFKK